MYKAPTVIQTIDLQLPTVNIYQIEATKAVSPENR